MNSEGANIRFADKRIEMAHGAGGEAARRLVEELIAPAFSNPLLAPLSDAAVLDPLLDDSAPLLAMTADSFVVKPLEFPGGSIGELAINGTVNDLAVAGARPIALTVSLILEAGLDAAILQREVLAMARAARAAGAPIVGGDTKVVEHGKADGIYISTTGVGQRFADAELGAERVESGDRVILSGPVGNHGVTIMIARAELDLEADVKSDTRPLTPLVKSLIDALGADLKWMRDATRGGVATVLNELARDVKMEVELIEESIPVDDPVRGACELLGLDPLQVANEGQFAAVVADHRADDAIEALRSVRGGERACIVGSVHRRRYSGVVAKAVYGGARVVDMLIGDPLPRIC